MTTPVAAILRGPSRSIRKPVKGASSPCSRVPREKPNVMAAAVQPISSRSGPMKTVRLKAAMPMVTKLLTAPP